MKRDLLPEMEFFSIPVEFFNQEKLRMNNNDLQKFKEDVQTQNKMIVSLAKYLDEIEKDVGSIKKDVRGFDGRMLIMALRIIELQEKVESIDGLIQSSKPSILERIEGLIQNRKKPSILARIKELIQNRERTKPSVLGSLTDTEQLSEDVSSSKALDGYSLNGELELEQDLSQFLSKLKDRY